MVILVTDMRIVAAQKQVSDEVSSSFGIVMVAEMMHEQFSNGGIYAWISARK